MFTLQWLTSDEPISNELSEALEAFEKQFTYPLDETQRFRISHGKDYARFYRSMVSIDGSLGPARVLIARDADEVIGVMAAVPRTVQCAHLSIPSLYLGDLKIASAARGRGLLYRMTRAMREAYRHIHHAYCAVMRGNELQPDAYTGRLGLPAFQHLSTTALARIPTATSHSSLNHKGIQCEVRSAAETEAQPLFDVLMKQTFYASRAQPSLRSSTAPQWYVARHDDQLAVARLENTMAAKQLLLVNGEPLHSAHLGAFACTDSAVGEMLLRHILQVCVTRQEPALFVSVPQSDNPLLKAVRAFIEPQSEVRIYATGPMFEQTQQSQWFVPSSEI